jgi:hypothetical protein
VTIGSEGRVRVVGDVHVREFDNELVILDLAKGDYFGVNELGAKLWQGLEKGKSCAEIATELVADYEVSEARLVADLVSMTDDFIARGLVEPVTPRP